jgi:hypothetical protein
MRPIVISLFAALFLAACGPDLCDAPTDSQSPSCTAAATPTSPTATSRAAIVSPRDPASGLPTGK